MTQRSGSIGRSSIVRVAGDVPATSEHERALSAAREAAGSVPVVRTGPTGITASDPLVMATRSGRTAFYANPSPSTVRELVTTLEAGAVSAEDADAVVDHDPNTTSLPVPDTGPLAVGQRGVLGACGWIDPLDPTERPFVATERTAKSVADVGILGRGRGDAATDEPVEDVWSTARSADGDPVVVINANEVSRTPRADATLLAGIPMAVLDGAVAIAELVGAEDVVVYLNESDTGLHRHLRAAIDAAADEVPIVPQLVAGPDEYRAGAPTAALEALEGAARIEPRVQPPTPAEYGLHGRPTVIHTPRTVAQVQRALREREAFDPTAADPGTRLITVAGDVRDPATVELGSSASLEAVRDAVEMTASFRMACVGGALGGITRDLDIAPTTQSLRAADLGTDGVVELLDETQCPVATAGERAKFAATENSGRCVPGREGTQQLVELLRDVYSGSFESDKIRELARVMARSSNCQIGAHAPRPVTTAIDEFEPEFRAHSNGRCSSGTCLEKL